MSALFWFCAGVAATLCVQWVRRGPKPPDGPIKYKRDGENF